MKIKYNFIKAASFASSKDCTREYLCGVNVIGTAEGTTYVATDGLKMIIVEDKTPNDDYFQALFPASAIGKISAMLPASKKRDSFGDIGNQVEAKYADGIITLKSCFKNTDIQSISFNELNGKYPKWQKSVVTDEELDGFKHNGRFTFGFNWNYLVDIQNAASCYRNVRTNVFGLKMSMANAEKPARLEDKDWDKSSSFTAIVMPMRV